MLVVSNHSGEARRGTWVKNCTPALPYMCRSPWKEPRQPVKEKNGRGTGMGTLMPTCAAPQACWNYRHLLSGALVRCRKAAVIAQRAAEGHTAAAHHANLNLVLEFARCGP